MLTFASFWVVQLLFAQTARMCFKETKIPKDSGKFAFLIETLSAFL